MGISGLRGRRGVNQYSRRRQVVPALGIRLLQQALASSGPDLEAATLGVSQLLELAGAADSSPKLLLALARNSHWEVRNRAAAHPDYPAAAIQLAARDKDIALRTGAAENPRCPPQILSRLARDRECSIRVAVAENPAVPAAVLAQLATDMLPEVRAGAVRNPTCTPELLERLADDRLMVRMQVAASAACPPSMLEGIVARNPEEPEGFGALLAVVRLAVDWETVVNGATAVRSTVAANAHCPPELLRQLAVDSQPLVRGAVACNLAVPASLLRQLSMDSDTQVRLMVASNLSAPPELLGWLVQDSQQQVARRAVDNPSCPPPIRAMWQLAHDET